MVASLATRKFGSESVNWHLTRAIQLNLLATMRYVTIREQISVSETDLLGSYMVASHKRKNLESTHVLQLGTQFLAGRLETVR